MSNSYVVTLPSVQLNAYAKLQLATQSTFDSISNLSELVYFAQEVRIKADLVSSGKLSLRDAVAKINGLRVDWSGVH